MVPVLVAVDGEVDAVRELVQHQVDQLAAVLLEELRFFAEPRIDTRVPRALDYATIERILAAIPDRGRPERDKKRATFSASKLRLRVLAYTGLTYAQLE